MIAKGAVAAWALALAVPALGARAPVAAGRFYPAKPKALAALVARQLAEAPAPKLPEGARVLALLVPHAGLRFSGPTAARAYKALSRGAYDAVVVLGTSHYKELESAALYPGEYATPEGALPYDETLARELLAAAPAIRADASAHAKEHSIEVQLPYLRRTLGRVPLVALVVNTQDLEAARQVGRAIAKAGAKRRLLIVVSSDQSHYPEGRLADAVDRTTLLALETLDPAYFWLANRFLMNRGLPHLAVTYCGEGAVTAGLEAARALGANRFRALAHINSGDVVSEREYNHVVGYASGLFTSEPGAAAARLTLSAPQRAAILAAAREAVSGKAPKTPLSAEPALNMPAALAIVLRSSDGATLGSDGAAQPQDSLLEAASRSAAAAAADPRFKAAAAAGRNWKVEVSLPDGVAAFAPQIFSQ